MAVDDTVCPSHERSRVALYCQTCETLICTKCVSHSPYSEGQHTEHVYLDIDEAYDMWQEELEKLLEGIRHDLQVKKNEKQRLQSNLQKLQLCLLRKRTELEKNIRSLKDQVYSKEKQYIASVEDMIVPDIDKVEEQHKSTEYDVVSAEGLLGTAVAIQEMPKSRAVSFLKSISSMKREYLAMHNRQKPEEIDASSKIQTVVEVTLNLHKEKYLIDRAFILAKTAPSMPQPIYSWCVVGHNSASLVWKFTKSDKIHKFHVYYKKFNTEDLKLIQRSTPGSITAIDRGIEELMKWDKKHRIASKASSQSISSATPESNTSAKSKNHQNPNNDQNYDDVENVFSEETAKQGHSNSNLSIQTSQQGIPDTVNSNDAVNHSDKQKKVSWFSLSRLLWWKSSGVKSSSVKVETSASDRDENKEQDSCDDKSNEEENRQRRIRKLSYTISPANHQDTENNENIQQSDSDLSVQQQEPPQRQYIDPIDFLNETQKYKNQAEKQAKVWPSSQRSSVASSVGYRRQASDGGLGSGAVNGSGGRKTSCPSASRFSHLSKWSGDTSILGSRHRPYRTHSVEAPVSRKTTTVTQHRSTTPQRYTASQNTRPRGARIVSTPPTKNTWVQQQKPSNERLSRRDQINSNNTTLSKSTYYKNSDHSNEDDENVKDSYNEKSHLLKKGLYEQRFVGTTVNRESVISGSYALYRGNNGGAEKSCSSDSSSGVDGLRRDKNRSRSEKGSGNDMNNVKNSDSNHGGATKRDGNTKQIEEISICSKENKTSTQDISEKVIKSDSSNEIIQINSVSNLYRNNAEFVNVNSIDKKEFKKFKISKFVIGRVQATIRDLEQDTDYLALVTASNQYGNSPATVFHFKTGALGHDGKKPSKCGHMISGDERYNQSVIRTQLSNFFSHFMCFLGVSFCLFAIFYLFSQNMQSIFCKSLSDEKSLSSLCPHAVIESLCSRYEIENKLDYQYGVTNGFNVDAKSIAQNVVNYVSDIVSRIL